MKAYIYIQIFLILSTIQISCKKFLDIGPPKTSVATQSVFENKDLATSAVINLYSSMTSSFASGSQSVTISAGVSSDELISYSDLLKDIYENEIDPTNSTSYNLYSGAYSIIFKTNSILEGLSSSTKLPPSVKNQLNGEAYFIRAFVYFYLVNLYGTVPLQLSSDYRITRIAQNSSENQIYQQVIMDLKAAEKLLTDQYVTTERVRANLTAVQAMLARTYLYLKDWQNAEKYATLIINKTDTYKLVDLDAVFLANSKEAILQLFPPTGSNGGDGSVFILTSTPSIVALRGTFFLNAFESNDKRKISWIRSYTNTTGTYYYPFKYKVRSSTSPSEYSMLLRFAEQYLIRSEARAEQNRLPEAIEDLDKIRNRASIPLIGITDPTISKSKLVAVIQNERRIELFSEWGHRWFDLKRIGKATETLSSVKAKWRSTDVLYPIPLEEINKNPNMNQNNGY